MEKKFTILRKSSRNEISEAPETLSTNSININERIKEKCGKRATKSIWKLFRMFGKSRKSEKGKEECTDIKNVLQKDQKGNTLQNENIRLHCSDSKTLSHRTYTNPFTSRNHNGFDMNRLPADSSLHNEVEVQFVSHTSLHNINLRFMEILASVNKKRESLMEMKRNKTQIYLEKTKKLISNNHEINKEPVRKIESVRSLVKENVCDTTYSMESIQQLAKQLTDVSAKISKTTVSMTDISIKMEMSSTQINGISPPSNSPQGGSCYTSTSRQADENVVVQQDPKTENVDETNPFNAYEETLHLLKSVCDKLITRDFDESEISQRTSIDAKISDAHFENGIKETIKDFADITLPNQDADTSGDLSEEICNLCYSESSRTLEDCATSNDNIPVITDNAENLRDMPSALSNFDKDSAAVIVPENEIKDEGNLSSVTDGSKTSNDTNYSTVCPMLPETADTANFIMESDLENATLKLNTIQNLYAPSSTSENLEIVECPKEDQSGKPDCATEEEINECTEKKMAYSLAEDDIKCLIKELLNESKNIKDTIVLTGVEEETEPPFTYDVKQETNLAIFHLCKSICEDVVTGVTSGNKTFNVPYKKNLFIPENEKSSAHNDVNYIINTLLEQTVNKWSARKNPFETDKSLIAVNYCLINDTPISNSLNKRFDSDRFRDSKLYTIVNKFWQSDKNINSQSMTRCHQFLQLPVVTVKNLSPIPKVNIFKTDDTLINRIKKSTTLLLALYDEMRDYSYHSTSGLFNDLYETINLLAKNELTQIVGNQPVNNVFGRSRLPRINTSNRTRLDESNSNGNNKSSINNEQFSRQEAFESQEVECCDDVNVETENYQAGTSCSNSATENVDEIKPTDSDDSFHSSEAEDELETSKILPNLKYTYISEDEMNTEEEIKEIETNVKENSLRNGNSSDLDEAETTDEDIMDDSSNGSGSSSGSDEGEDE